MAAVLIAAGTATGALVGLVAAIVITPFGSFSGGAVLVAVAIGLVLDGLNLAVGGPRPPASGRQVPQEWSRLFEPRVVALLYGARLGVGPLTILSTWTWWSATIAAALIGPVEGAVVGATFGFVRLAVTVGVSVFASWVGSPSPEWRSRDPRLSGPADSLETTGPYALEAPDLRRRSLLFSGLRARQRSNWMAINGIGFLALLAVVLTGCGTDADDGDQSATGSTTPRAAIDQPGGTADPTTDPRLTPIPEFGPGRNREATATDDLETIATVPLENVVRPANPDTTLTEGPVGSGVVAGSGEIIIPPGRSSGGSSGPSQAGPGEAVPLGADSAASSAEARPSSAPAALAATLLTAIDGFEPVDDPAADRHLNISAASNLQPDPIEELALLETRGFEGGWTRAFLNETNDVAVASVYQFEDAAEAEFYLEDGLITIGGYGGKFFDIDGQPGVRGFIQYFTETDGSGREELVSLGAAFQTGPRWYLVYFVGSVDTVTPALLFPTIAAQRQAVTG